MTGSAATPNVGGTTMRAQETREAAREITRYWWISLVVGVAWIAAALVILQFDQASITTIGIIVGIMFVAAGVQQLTLAAIADEWRWLWALFGVLFLVAAVICFIDPKSTFAGLADILGFLFLTVGVWWTIQAFIERPVNPVWWLGLVSGIAMIVLAFWTSGQFFLEKSYTLLVFAGIWALFHGLGDVVRAFQLRGLHDRV